MIKIVKPKKYDRVYKYYKLCGNDRIMIVKKYSKGWYVNYLKDLIEPFETLVNGVIYIVISPFKLISVLYSFIPRVVIKDKNISE